MKRWLPFYSFIYFVRYTSILCFLFPLVIIVNTHACSFVLTLLFNSGTWRDQGLKLGNIYPDFLLSQYRWDLNLGLFSMCPAYFLFPVTVCSLLPLFPLQLTLLSLPPIPPPPPFFFLLIFPFSASPQFHCSSSSDFASLAQRDEKDLLDDVSISWVFHSSHSITAC